METNPTRELALWAMVAFFTSGGLLSALFFLLGSFGEFQGRVLATVFSLGFFSLLILLSASKFDHEDLAFFARIGVLSGVLAAAMLQLLIWRVLEPGEFGFKAIGVLTVLAFGVAHAMALWRSGISEIASLSLRLTLFSISVVCIMLIITILGLKTNEFFFRGLGFFAVLDVAGTIITPLLAILTKPATESA
ncbi:hypothetical protein HYU18_05250 [Candidatus Woesearchaeota archaeon]|nr:hypothetical protein [Candidatus Woesearchaeota archaeon]